jgi:3-oxoacyl-(acyl-carrier-protein) synthase
MRALTRSTDPDRASRPFDRDHDGFVGTGGAVAMILEAEEVAQARSARAYARMLGYGQASDGFNPVLPQPKGDGLARAMEMALKRSGIGGDGVDYVNAHAPSTPMGDAAEVHALTRVFGTNGRSPLVSSTKALTGHALSMSSALEAGISVLALREGFVPGSANYDNPEEGAEKLHIPRETLDQPCRRIVSNSSGFGGSNVSLVFEAA